MIGIPYMGSKRKLAEPIINYILAHNPTAKYIFDLFGGGGAISFEALKRKQFLEVHYNELNTGVVELLKKIRKDGVTDEFYNWIDRNTFNKHKNDDDWFGGLLKTCWSFGNNQSAYLFGKDIEEPKGLMHEVVVNCCEESLKRFNEMYSIDVSSLLFNIKGINKRRLQFQKELSKVYIQTKSKELKEIGVSNMSILDNLRRIELLKEICIFDKNVRHTHQQLEHLQRLERLQQLQQLQQLDKLKITNLSYEQVQISTPIDETIIYLDPPYFNTQKYALQMCQDTLIDWIKQSPYKIYVSSYAFPLPIVKEFNHRSTLSATANNKTVERLFCNRTENIKTELF
jgi:16S rRNA G966 N2-methylase RsmD